MKVKVALKQKDKEHYKEKRRHEEMKRLVGISYEKFLIDEIKKIEESGILETNPATAAVYLNIKREKLRKIHEYNQKMGYTIEEAVE